MLFYVQMLSVIYESICTQRVPTDLLGFLQFYISHQLILDQALESLQLRQILVEWGTLLTDGDSQSLLVVADFLDRVWTDMTEWCELSEQQRNLMFSCHIHHHHYLLCFLVIVGGLYMGLLSCWAGNVGAWRPWQPRPLCLWLNCQTQPLILFFDGGLVVEENNVGLIFLQEDIEGEKA